jgi:hypothetical protein
LSTYGTNTWWLPCKGFLIDQAYQPPSAFLRFRRIVCGSKKKKKKMADELTEFLSQKEQV